MTLFLTLLLVLWGIPQAGAVPWEDPTPLRCKKFDDANAVCFGTPSALIEILTIYRIECFAQLQAAMKAMEPWMLRAVVDPLDKNKRITNFVPFDATMEKSESFQQWKVALEQWDAAKACWRKETP